MSATRIGSRLRALLLCSALLSAAACGAEWTVTTTAQPNLVDNPGFEALDARGMPVGWSFANLAGNDTLKADAAPGGFGGGRAARVTTPGELPGYWTHNRLLPVTEGRTYYARARFRADGPKCLLWLRTDQYDDGGSPLLPPWSQTEIFSYGESGQSAAAAHALGLFIDPSLIRAIDAREWSEYSLEFTVPVGHGVTEYLLRAGAYYGGAGWMMVDDVYFGSARRDVTAELTGSGWVKAGLATQAGDVVREWPLDPNNDRQRLTFDVPSTKTVYILTATGKNGETLRKEF